VGLSEFQLAKVKVILRIVRVTLNRQMQFVPHGVTPLQLKVKGCHQLMQGRGARAFLQRRLEQRLGGVEVAAVDGFARLFTIFLRACMCPRTR
jgi:hypothetical protein